MKEESHMTQLRELAMKAKIDYLKEHGYSVAIKRGTGDLLINGLITISAINFELSGKENLVNLLNSAIKQFGGKED